VNDETVCENKPRRLHLTLLPIHYSLDLAMWRCTADGTDGCTAPLDAPSHSLFTRSSHMALYSRRDRRLLTAAPNTHPLTIFISYLLSHSTPFIVYRKLLPSFYLSLFTSPSMPPPPLLRVFIYCLFPTIHQLYHPYQVPG